MSVPDTAAVLEDLALSFDARASIARTEGENISANAYENAAALLRRRALSLPPFRRPTDNEDISHA